MFGRKKISEGSILRSFHALLSAGISVQEAASGIAEKMPDRKTAERLQMLAELIKSEGRTFPEAARDVDLFPDSVDLLDIGQKTGNLRGIMRDIADLKEELDHAGKKVKSAIMYPVMVVIFSIFVGYGLSFVLGNVLSALKMPQIEKVFTFRMGNFIVNNREILFLGYSAALCGLMWAVLKNVHKLPFVKGIYNTLSIGRSFRTFTVGISSGLSPAQCFAMVAGTLKGKWKDIFAVLTEEAETRNISDVVDEIGEFLPPESYLILKTKIDSGSMAEGFQMVGNSMMRDALRKLGDLGTIVNVVAMMFVAVQVIVLISPIYGVIIAAVDAVSGSSKGFQ